MTMTRTALGAILLLTLAVLSASAAPAFTASSTAAAAAGRLEELVRREGIYVHLNEFQRIADLPENRGSRAVFLGYNQSAEYVLARLAETDLAVSIQTLPAAVSEYVVDPVLALVKPFETSFKLNADFLGYNLAGSGSIEAQVQFVRGGCTSQDFARFTPGRIALLNRGAFTPAASNTTACPYRNLIDNAIAARASAVLVFNPDDFLPMLGGTNDAPVPVFGVSSAVANFLNELLLDGSEVVVRLQAESKKSTYTTYNILAETKTGKDDQVIVIGSHLDSVPAGAGINDNGSGSATILETALQFGKIPAPVNKVRFAWWAGEEWGLYGSNYYVDNLSRRELDKIALNLNFDMIGSPNYIRGIFNGRTATEDIRAGSTAIQELFEQHFDSKGLQYEPTPFNGRSDYGPFIENGIPAGGLFTGAEEKKTVEQRARYGGSANVAQDSCYHLSCDNVGNISPTAIEEMSAAAVSVLETLAFKEDLEGFLGGRSGRRNTAPKTTRSKAPQDTC